MFVLNALDLLYFCLAIAILFVAGYLCWLLYEAAYLLHQTNATVKDARNKIQRIEDMLGALKDKLESLSGMAGGLAMGGKMLAKYLSNKQAAKKGKKKSKKSDDEDEE